MNPQIISLRLSAFLAVTGFVSVVLVCVLPIAANAEGQFAVFPNVDATQGVGPPFGNNPKRILSALQGAGVLIVTPQSGGTAMMQVDAYATGIRQDAIKETPHINFGNGLVIQVPAFDRDVQKFLGSDGQPFDFGGTLTIWNKSLPGLSPKENLEFRDLSGRLGTLDHQELDRLKQLFERGISMPIDTGPVRPKPRISTSRPKPRTPIFVGSSSDCPNGKVFPSYCKYFVNWKPSQCTCD